MNLLVTPSWLATAVAVHLTRELAGCPTCRASETVPDEVLSIPCANFADRTDQQGVERANTVMAGIAAELAKSLRARALFRFVELPVGIAGARTGRGHHRESGITVRFVQQYTCDGSDEIHIDVGVCRRRRIWAHRKE